MRRSRLLPTANGANAYRIRKIAATIMLLHREKNMRKLLHFAILALSAATMASQAQEHRQGPAARASAAPVKKWETDAALRQNMDNIRKEMTARQQEIEQDRLDSATYRKLAETVDRQLKEIFANRNLRPEIRSALNSVVFTDMVNSLDLMRSSPKQQAQRIAALGVLRSLKNYGDYFEHPGWEIRIGEGAAK